MYRLRARGRIYLPAGGTDGRCTGQEQKRVWIDSQTEEEILRGVKEAKDLSAYDHLADSAYLRAKEDYLMGINFSRLLTLKYGQTVLQFLCIQSITAIIGRTCDDLRPWDGRAQRTGNTELCENAVFSCSCRFCMHLEGTGLKESGGAQKRQTMIRVRCCIKKMALRKRKTCRP